MSKTKKVYIAVSPSFRQRLKKRAAELDISMIELTETLGKKKKAKKENGIFNFKI